MNICYKLNVIFVLLSVLVPIEKVRAEDFTSRIGDMLLNYVDDKWGVKKAEKSGAHPNTSVVTPPPVAVPPPAVVPPPVLPHLVPVSNAVAPSPAVAVAPVPVTPVAPVIPVVQHSPQPVSVPPVPVITHAPPPPPAPVPAHHEDVPPPEEHEPVKGLSVASVHEQINVPVIAPPQVNTVSAKRYLGQLFYDLKKMIPWAMVKSGSWAGKCVVPKLLDMNGKEVKPTDRYQAEYFRKISGLVQFTPDQFQPTIPQIDHHFDSAFLKKLAGYGCYQENGHAVIYKATMMIDLDVVEPTLGDTEVKAQLIELKSVPGYIMAVITHVGDNPLIRNLVGACVDFDHIYRSDGTVIPHLDKNTFISQSIRGFLTLDPTKKQVLAYDKKPVAYLQSIMHHAVSERKCMNISQPLKISILRDGVLEEAAELVEWVNPYKATHR